MTRVPELSFSSMTYAELDMKPRKIGQAEQEGTAQKTLREAI